MRLPMRRYAATGWPSCRRCLAWDLQEQGDLDDGQERRGWDGMLQAAWVGSPWGDCKTAKGAPRDAALLLTPDGQFEQAAQQVGLGDVDGETAPHLVDGRDVGQQAGMG